MKQLYLILGIIAMFFIGGGLAQLNLSNPFTSSDFTLTNIEVVGSNIQLTDEVENQVISTTWSSVSSTLLAWDSDKLSTPTSSARLGVQPTTPSGQETKFCLAFGGSYVSSSTATSSSNDIYYYENSQSAWTSSGSGYQVSSVTCSVPTGNYNSFGNIEQTSYITISEPYNYFELQYDVSLNGESIQPYLLIGETRYNFNNNKLSTEKIPSDTQIKLGFDFTGSTNTPQLNNDIVLLGSFSESSSSDSEDNKALNVLTTLSASSSEKLKTNYLADFVYNITQPFVEFLKSLF